jgi:hypothetical protein
LTELGNGYAMETLLQFRVKSEEMIIKVEMATSKVMPMITKAISSGHVCKIYREMNRKILWAKLVMEVNVIEIQSIKQGYKK